MEQIKITINEKDVYTSPEKTIIEAVHENKLDVIPTLCYDKRIEHITSCFLCVVEVEGINKLIPSCSTKVKDGMKIHTRTQKIIEIRKTALELLMSNHYADCIAPCKMNCPAGVDVQSYIALISLGRYEEALKLVKENNPLPLSISRVCVRDCEASCRRNFIDEPVAVNALKRFIADDNSNKWIPEIKGKKNKKVAVIGGGPAGLSCAYYLTVEGYSVTIFEKLPKLGGMLRYGIPEYRLPKEVLDSEIKWMLDLGIEVKTGVELGLDFNLQELLSEEYDAVFLGVGAHKASKLGVDGEDSTYGVFRGIDFLREIQLSHIPELKGKVIVVGGGNTAIDAARTALRCGAENVKIVYRRSLNEMPAGREEIMAAQKEGIEILFLTNPKSIIAEDNRLKAIECLRMELIEGKPGERPRPVPKPGSEFIIECDYLIGAIGQSVDTSFSKSNETCSLGKSGVVCINENTMETSIPGVFAGGDVVTGPLTAITAIAHGKKAAIAIMNFIETGRAGLNNGKFISSKNKLAKLSKKEFEHFNKSVRVKMKELAVKERVHNFKEVELVISEEQSICETGRCLECGCSEYYDCSLRKYCDEYKIDITQYLGEVKKYLTDGRHPFIFLDPNKCIDCGKCVRTCAEVLEVSALGFINRGFKSIVKPAMEKPLMETNCISCGNCIDACPTGAIKEKYPFKILGRLPKENYETICNFCSVGCKVNFKKINDEVFYVSNTTPEIMNSHNRGYLCSKGRFGHRYLLSKNRIMHHAIRRKDIIQNVNRDEIFPYVYKKLKSIIDKYGRDSIAVFGSPRLSNEELYLLQKFARTGLKTNNIHSFSNLLYGVEQNSLDGMMGFTNSTISMDSLNSADIIIVLNSNLSEENLVMELKIKEAQKKGTKLILFSSSEVRLTKFADLWIDSKKGTNTYLLNAIMKCCIDNGLIDAEFINSRTSHFDEVRTMIEKTNIQEAIEFSGVKVEKYEMLFNLIKDLNSNIVFVNNIDSHREKSVNDLKAIADFLLLTGRIGKNNNGIILLREFNNSSGHLDMGVNPGYLPGYIKLNEVDEVSRISRQWNSELKDVFKPVNLIKSLEKGEIKAILIFGEDPLAVKENIRYFSGVEFLVVCDTYFTDTAKEADVLIPAPTYLEQSGSFTQCDGTVQQSTKINSGVFEFENWQTISAIASLFAQGFEYNSTEGILNEIKSVNRFYKYFSYDNSWLNNYFNNGFKNQRMSFINYGIDFSTFNPVKQVIDYQENYYINSIKMKLL
ncbi:MAG: FAD-dependent oxidoreductase [Ignavibacteriaceae bacterium]|nr:FAD-dependent oxidoreductase [Ignavibacteriaceae bacterium]